MNHKVTNVQKLHDDATALYNNVVVGAGEASADTILNNLYVGIENLKTNWKGVDAGVQIQNVIRVHNAMVGMRNALAQLAVDSSKIAANYREIQRSNGSNLDMLGVLSFDAKTIMSDYSDTNDTVDINSEVNNGKQRVDAANNAIDSFVANVKSGYQNITDNWIAGSGRDSAIEAFDAFLANASQYKQLLAEVSNHITTALSNYSM